MLFATSSWQHHQSIQFPLAEGFASQVKEPFLDLLGEARIASLPHRLLQGQHAVVSSDAVSVCGTVLATASMLPASSC